MGAGIAQARGEFLCLLMDDDYYRPSFLAHRVSALRNYPHAVVAFSGYDIVDHEGKPLRQHRPQLPAGVPLRGPDSLRAALGRSMFVGATMYRTAAVKNAWPAIEGFGYVVDYALDLHLAVSPGTAFFFLETCDFVMMSHAGQVSNGRRDKVYVQAIEVLKDLLVAPIPPWARRLVVTELANWYLLAGRRAAAQGKRRLGLRRMLHSLWHRPFITGTWKQLARVLTGL